MMVKGGSHTLVSMLMLTLVLLAPQPASGQGIAVSTCPLCSIDKQIHRELAKYDMPDILLRNQTGKEVALRVSLSGNDRPVVLQFAFTSCTTLCPIMTSAVSGAQKNLGNVDDDVLYVTISIDPTFDTPARLTEFAKNLDADEDWLFLTGNPHDVISVQKAFNAFPGNKARHEALTFLRRAGEGRWTRITGVLSAASMEEEIRKLVSIAPTEPNLEVGRRIYEDGVLPDGSSLSAVVLGDIVLRGKNAACAKCHRRSGFGSDEPGKLVPAITGEILFSQLTHQRSREYRALYQEPQTSVERSDVRSRTSRSAYTPDSLRVALSEGTDADGRNYNSLQPHYSLNDEEYQHLVSYLQSLGAGDEEGVDENFINFGYVFDDLFDPLHRKAQKDTIRAFVQRRNIEVDRFRLRPGISPLYKSEMISSYRKWKIHFLELSNDPATGRHELETFYQQTPVFAFLLGGGDSAFQTTHNFCEQRDIPYLFPTADISGNADNSRYTFRFLNGLTSYLQGVQTFLAVKPFLERVVVVAESDELAGEIADTLQSLDDGSDRSALFDAVDFDSALMLPNMIGTNDCVLAVSENLNEKTIHLLNKFRELKATVVLLSPNLRSWELSSELNLGLDRDINVCFPYLDTRKPNAELYRQHAWFRSRGIDASGSIQDHIDTYFVLNLLHHSINHMVDRYDREYLIERLEHEAENVPDPGVYSGISLGPGQRTAVQAVPVKKIGTLSAFGHH